MPDDPLPLPDRPLDLAIIGAGLAGLVHLHYARQAGLDALVLDRAAGVGGLWRDLPDWQDIQICPVDWTLGDIPITGPRRADIVANVEQWVPRFGLADGLRLNTPVQLARHNGEHWELHTPQGTLRARHLVAATGAHNTPVIPEVRRSASTVRELHSSALRDPTELAGREVLVVGGGASAFDLLDLGLEHQAGHIHWVYRGLRWFTPTNKPKAIAGSFRPFAKLQASGMPPAKQNELINADLRARYAKFGLQALLPEQPLDVLRDQIIPGRARMLGQLGALQRHPGTTVQAIEGPEVLLSDGSRLRPDVLLWGTGYGTHLGFFEEPRVASLRSVGDLAARCACMFRSMDAPNLYFPGVFLDGIGATAWANAMLARTVMSHIRGTARLDMAPVPHKLNHLDMVAHLAQRDPYTYGEGRGLAFYRDLTLNLPDDQPYPMP